MHCRGIYADIIHQHLSKRLAHSLLKCMLGDRKNVMKESGTEMPRGYAVLIRIILACLTLAFLTQPTLADIKKTIAGLAPKGLVLVLNEKGKTLVEHNAGRGFSPASVTKIVTAWLALEVLGSDHRFETRFYLDENRNLYVRGGGDPFLVSEEVALLAQNLIKVVGKESLADMVLDASYYPPDLRIPGIKHDKEAYNANNSSLALNFNTIHAVRRGKTVRSAEKQTPITPTAITQFKARGPKGRGRISLNQQDPLTGVRYAGELIAAFITKSGGTMKGNIKLGKVPQGLRPIHVHRQTRSLSEIISQMLLGSNNFIANQIFLEIGAHGQGGPVSLAKSIATAEAVFSKYGLAKAFVLKEGSGISSDNKISAHGLGKLLHHFAPNAGLLVKNRAGSRYKTGSIPGVRTLAGYAKTSRHGTVRFVISLRGNTGRLRFRLLRAIERNL